MDLFTEITNNQQNKLKTCKSLLNPTLFEIL